MAQRRSGNSHTTISITWADKDEFRRFAKEVKTTKNGKMFEPDAELFTKLLEYYKSDPTHSRNDIIPKTYPNKISQDDVQLDSSHEEPK
jgi:hypothetical protein